LTPIVKGCLTEWGVECTYHALQCFGGHGYMAEHGMEQLARDARITTLYEGTTGIQALDLMGRKTMQQQAAGLKVFLGMVQRFCEQQVQNQAMAEFIGPLMEKAQEWQALTIAIAGRAGRDPEEIGAAAHDYLFYSGYVVLAYWWARSVAAADASGHPQAFKDAKRETARFYYARLLPRTLAHKAAIESGPAPLLALDEAASDAGPGRGPRRGRHPPLRQGPARTGRPLAPRWPSTSPCSACSRSSTAAWRGRGSSAGGRGSCPPRSSAAPTCCCRAWRCCGIR